MTERQKAGELRTLPDVLRDAAREAADVEAFVEPAAGGRARRSLTFAEWDGASDGVAGLFAVLGVGRGTVVSLWLPSSIDYMVCYAAAAKLGAVTSGVNPRLGGAEARSILERTKPVVTVVPDADNRPDGPVGAVVTVDDVRRAATGPAPTGWPVLDPSDPVVVAWTSGTTGVPKGAVFDHRNLFAVAAGTDSLSAAGDRRLSPLPFAHVGTVTRTVDEALKRVTTVITPTPWRAVDAIAVMEAERVTVAQGVPTQWALVLDRPELEAADLSSLRVVGTGGARVPEELVAALRDRLGVPVVVRYTSTEASLGTGTRPDDADAVVATTVGRPVAGVELRVVDDDGQVVATGEVGRVEVRSPAVMRGYWGGPLTGVGAAGVVFDERATAAVVRPGGWLAMGDFGALDAAGNLRLAGREHDRYLRGGYNVYPAEVEAALATLDGVAEAAVVGVPDPVLGEVGVAFVVMEDRSAPPPAPDDLLGSVRAGLAPLVADYKVPDRVVAVGALPLTPMSKLDRQTLRRWAEDGPADGARPAQAPAQAPRSAAEVPETAGRRPATTTRS